MNRLYHFELEYVNLIFFVIQIHSNFFFFYISLFF